MRAAVWECVRTAPPAAGGFVALKGLQVFTGKEGRRPLTLSQKREVVKLRAEGAFKNETDQEPAFGPQLAKP